QVEDVLSGCPDPARIRRLLAACEAIRVAPVIRRLYPGAAPELARLDEFERRRFQPRVGDRSSARESRRAPGWHSDRIAAALDAIRLGMPPSPIGAPLPARLEAAPRAPARPRATTSASRRCALACCRPDRGAPLPL